jgi:hypothetical protein
MAFNSLTVVNNGGTLPAVGSYCALAVGTGTCVAGLITVTAPGLRRIEGIVGCTQGATTVGEAVICTATSGNTAALETTDANGTVAGTSVIMWVAWGPPAA